MAAMHGTEPPLNLGAWLVQLGTLTGGKASAAEVREKGAAYAQALRAEFSPSVFTADSVRHVARHANAGGYFPTYAEVCRALTAWAEANPVRPAASPLLPNPGPALSGKGHGEALHWARYCQAKFAEGADQARRAHLLSLVRSRLDGQALRFVMAQCFPTELAADDAHTEEVRRDKAQRAEDIRRGLVQAWAMPKAAKSAPAPAESPADPPPRTRQAERSDLALLLRTFEAAVKVGNPPANAEARIAGLRARLADLAEPEPERTA
jgi:hypothetical protein